MIITMRTMARLETLCLEIAFWVSLILGGLPLLLTVSGLFSVLSYLVEQRTREIGVRIALGASSEVTQLMLSQTARPVMYGLIAGRRPDRPDRARHRSGRVRRQADRHHRRLPGGRVDSRYQGRARRSNANAPAGVNPSSLTWRAGASRTQVRPTSNE
jgi:hypothetical protein